MMASGVLQIGKYAVERELGRGGMGVVYLARDPTLERLVALKVLDGSTPGDGPMVARLEREARLLAALNHPNVAAVFGLESAGGAPVLVIEYVEGESLGAALDRGAMPERQALEICVQIARGLGAAHGRGIIHRDLTPRNVMLGPGGVAKVLDFGLARRVDAGEPAGSGPTATSIGGIVVGTPGYISPEQARGLTVDHRTDIFSLGCIVFECLAGVPAFGGRTRADRLARCLAAKPDWSVLPAPISAGLRALVGRCLSAEAASRPSASEVCAEMEAFLTGRGTPQRRGNLPATATTFVGRERELAEVRSLLASRLLTLTGPGGVGKTRLAIQAAAGLEAECPGGVWMVELAALTDPGLVPQALLACLGLREEPGRPAVETAAERLGGAPALLVIDNCEHLIVACAGLAAGLLSRCPALRIVATSREALAVPGECVYRVPPMAESEAVGLFLERGRLSRPGVGATLEDRAAVAQVCRRLDGIPLAIELAAARAGAMSVADISQRLEDRFGLLTGGSRVALPRQRTLLAMVEWSYGLLSGEERTVLRRLSVFSGGWTLAAAEDVCAGDGIDRERIAGVLADLVGKSLVVFDDAAAPGRYRLLETIRQYARRRLEGDRKLEVARVRTRHMKFFLAPAEPAEKEDQVAWLDRLAAEHENMRAALEFARSEKDWPMVLQIATALRQFWYVRGHLSEARAWLEPAIAARGNAEDALQAAAYRAVGVFAWRQGDGAAAEEWYELALGLFEKLGDWSNVAGVLSNLGLLFDDDGRTEKAMAAHGRALKTYRALRDADGEAKAQLNLGSSLVRVERYREAEELFQRCLRRFRSCGDNHRLAIVLHNLGETACRQAFADDRAEHWLSESLALRERLADRQGVPLGILWLGIAKSRRGRLAEAACLLGLAERLRQQLPAHGIPDSDRSEYKQALQTVRDGLGEDKMMRAWEGGTRADLDRILDSSLPSQEPHAQARLLFRDPQHEELPR